MEKKFGEDPEIKLVQWYIPKHLFVLLRVKLKDWFIGFIAVFSLWKFKQPNLWISSLKLLVH